MTTTGNMKKGNVKKRAVGKPGLANSDDYARAIIAEGKRVREDPDQALDHPVITSRGIMIALATALVESNMLIYANHDDPESLKYPHDVIGIRPNEKRVGLFKGDLWLDAKTGMPVRESGVFVKTPSVFLKKVEFLQQYEIQNGIAIPKHLESKADVRLVGRAELNMDFSNFTRPEVAEEEQPASIATPR